MRKNAKWFLSFILSVVVGFQATPMLINASARNVTMNNYYENGMIFQQKKPIRLSGYGDIGSEVTATIKKATDQSVVNTISGTIDDKGKFILELPAMNASYTTYTIDLISNGITVSLQDVLIGELWLNAGQSNMELKVMQDLKKDDLLANVASNPIRSKNIRIYSSDTLEVDKSYTPVEQVENAHWKYGDSTTDMSSVSAVSYSFALEMFEKLNKNGNEVPIGILSITKGASQISAWMSREVWDATIDYKFEKWPPKYDESNWNTAPAFYKATQETAMYNHYIYPLSTLNIGGMIWYQGESDAAYNKTYPSALKALIQLFRQRFSHGETVENIPFVAIQPAPHNYQYAPDGGLLYDMLPNLWEAYVKVMKDPSIENFCVVPIYDLPVDFVTEYGAIHPGIKQPIGQRAATTAYGLAYNRDEEYMAPVYQAMEIKDHSIVLTFDHVGDGLRITDGSKDIHGFAICGSDRIFINAQAKIIGPNKVEVWSDNLKHPVAVHYAYAPMNMQSNLGNSLNIVALPFRTDAVASTLYRPKAWQYCDSEKIWVSWTALGPSYDTKAKMSPAWKLANISNSSHVSFSFDSDKVSEGKQSMKIVYMPDTSNGSLFGVTPILEYSGKNRSGYPGTYNQFENFECMYFDVFNPDPRVKTLAYVEMVGGNGKKYRLGVLNKSEISAAIPASDDWTTIGVDFRTAYNEDGSIAADFNKTIKDIKALNFTFKDDQEGTLHLDNIRFGYAPIKDASHTAHAAGNSNSKMRPSFAITALSVLAIAVLAFFGVVQVRRRKK